jgi:citrate lyase subunit beta/citryl-CoA lyase
MSAEVMDRLTLATTFLFVPGDKPDRFAKAFSSGADLVIIDLEDAVAPDLKTNALNNALGALEGKGVPEGFHALIRVNGNPEELRALSNAPRQRLDGIVLPKAEYAQQISEVNSLVGEPLRVIALIETAKGVCNALEIAGHSSVTRIAFGAVDFAADVESNAYEILDFARAQLVVASRAHGKPAPIESPTTTFKDLAQVEENAARARSLGFGATLCIHPAQIAPAKAGFVPSPEEIDWAQQVVSLEGGATQIDGMMVDKPLVDRAKTILARAHEGK